MRLGYELVKEQLFFRKERRERVHWFIRIRWMAVAGALLGSWGGYLLEPELPILPLNIILLIIILYNIVFHFIWKRLSHFKPDAVRPFVIFAHTQISFDLLSLYSLIFITGGFCSPLLMFSIFHIILSGILLSPMSCFLYAILVISASGSLILLQKLTDLPFQSIFSKSPYFACSLEFPQLVILFLTFASTILITAFLTTSIKLGLRIKAREVLDVSRELDASNAKLTALYEMVKEMGVCSGLQELMDSATRNAARIMGVKGCSIKLLDNQRKVLKFVSAYGLSEDYVARGSIDIEKSPINREIIQGSFYSIGKIEEKDHFQYPEDIRKEGIASMVCLPLRVRKVVLGVFCVYSDVSYYFVESDVEFFSLMTDLTALSIEKLRSELNKAWFLEKAAHQLRSPFNAIYSMLKTMRQGYLGPVSQKQGETLERCEKRIEILGHVIKDLLELGIKRTEAKEATTDLVDSAKVMTALASLFEARALEKGISIIFESDDSIPEIILSKKQVDDIFTNLISNAIKYTPQGGEVRVVLSRERQNRVRFEVCDTGIGIPEEDMSRLFSEFFRAENARAFTEVGTGLGLVIVKEILDQVKGSISVKSKVGEGTCFTCMLPSV